MTYTKRYKENLTILAAWGLVFASTPLYMYYAMLAIDIEFNVSELIAAWSYNLGFLILFLIHHYLLIPKFIVRKRIKHYVAGIAIIVSLFGAFLINIEPHFHPKPALETLKSEQTNTTPGKTTAEGGRLLLPPPVMARLIIGILMLGVDLGVAGWFNQQKMRQRLLMLEQQNIRQELEQLRYQINPHFFMNTLNNINALIDIDQEQAKEAVVQLSKLMRYSLYEGNNSHATLKQETEFIRQYISLMRLRFSSKVEVVCDLNDDVNPNASIPSLLLATFVENAFKHGISYQQKSFIHISLKTDDKNIDFRCVNSNHVGKQPTRDKYHGIGIANLKKRLGLIYADDYLLEIRDETDTYSVKLVLPTQYS